MMKKAALLLPILALALAGAVPAAATAPTVTLESQGWWNKTGIVIPSDVGQHVHLKATVPVDGVPIDGTVIVPVDITLHNQTGAVTELRVQEADNAFSSGKEQVLVPVALGPCADCTIHVDVTLDFSKWTTGRDEMRFTANIPSNSDGQRQYQSTGWEVCVRSCTPSYRTPPWNEVRGWYTGHGYQNAKLSSALSTVASSGTIGVKLAPGSGGLATKFSGVYIDPDFHHGSSGIVVKTVNGSYTGSVVLPVLASGTHSLVLIASDGFDAGVLKYTFIVP